MSSWQIKVLIDGACPLCRREADLWRRLDRDRGRIALEDIGAPGFEAARYGEAAGVRIVLLDAPGRPDGIELALRTSGLHVQTVAFPVSAVGSIIRALLCAVADLGEVDRLIREEMEHRVVLDAARPAN